MATTAEVVTTGLDPDADIALERAAGATSDAAQTSEAEFDVDGEVEAAVVREKSVVVNETTPEVRTFETETLPQKKNS